MRRRGGFVAQALTVAVLGAAAAAPMYAAGFGIFEQGAKAMGEGGAFTAQADDPSAMFFNAGGVAFMTKREFSIGTTYIHDTKADFKGADPYPGAGNTASQKKLSVFLPHVYYVQPINDTWKFGIGVFTPFGLTTDWENPDTFSGRFVSTKAALRVFDFNPTLGWQVTPDFGIGFGGVVRYSDVELNRHIAAQNPFTFTAADIARLKLKGDFKTAYGWNAGVLHKVSPSFSWGLSYRSKITLNYTGNARLTQLPSGNPVLDAVVAASLPFNTDLPVKTKINFPDQASLGLAFGITPDLLIETDVNWTGWSTLKDVPITFTGGATNSLPSTSIEQSWKDAYNYRLGLRWTTSPSSQWRFGYVYDQTPQREEAVSPLLPDADRNGFSVGYGWTGGIKADFALMYLPFHQRSRDKSFASDGPFFGTYNTTAWLFSATLGF